MRDFRKNVSPKSALHIVQTVCCLPALVYVGLNISALHWIWKEVNNWQGIIQLNIWILTSTAALEHKWQILRDCWHYWLMLCLCSASNMPSKGSICLVFKLAISIPSTSVYLYIWGVNIFIPNLYFGHNQFSKILI